MNSKSNKVTKTLSPDLSLTKDQQELLMTALSSNRPNATAANPKNLSNGPNPGPSNPADNLTKPAPTAGKANVFQSPIQSSPGSGNSSSLKFDQSPFLEYDLDDGNFDWDNNGETMFGNLPGTLNEDDGELHDKRKNPQEEGDGEESGNKRREGEDKLAKKPGRKPLTGEPTTVRSHPVGQVAF